MGKIGYGYGSEWQLMRMLGRHRMYSDNLIGKEYQSIEYNIVDVKWFDFKFKGNYDEEILGKDLFKVVNIKCKDNILRRANWDCIGQIEDTFLLGEAKGHIKELLKTDKSSAGKVSRNTYLDLVEEIMKKYKINMKYKDVWVTDAFQLGNRIATQYYLEKNNIKCSLLYILFIEDWNLNLGGEAFDSSYSVKNKDEWDEAFKKQIHKLGFISQNYQKIMLKFMFVYPRCIE